MKKKIDATTTIESLLKTPYRLLSLIW